MEDFNAGLYAQTYWAGMKHRTLPIPLMHSLILLVQIEQLWSRLTDTNVDIENFPPGRP